MAHHQGVRRLLTTVLLCALAAAGCYNEGGAAYARVDNHTSLKLRLYQHDPGRERAVVGVVDGHGSAVVYVTGLCRDHPHRYEARAFDGRSAFVPNLCGGDHWVIAPGDLSSQLGR
jgi:hypothetical protein